MRLARKSFGDGRPLLRSLCDDRLPGDQMNVPPKPPHSICVFPNAVPLDLCQTFGAQLSPTIFTRASGATRTTSVFILVV